MTTFHSRQSDRGRRVRQKADANAFQISVTNSTTKLRGSFHETRKIVCNNFSSWCNHKVQCYRFNEVQALPLVSTRILRLANSSPKIALSPARRSRDGRETSGKKSGEISRVMSAQRPGNGRTVATAMPRDGRPDDSQDNLPCAGLGRAMSAPEACETTRNLAAKQPRNISQDDSSESRRHVFNNPVLKL
jgi:hypothetical protein